MHELSKFFKKKLITAFKIPQKENRSVTLLTKLNEDAPVVTEPGQAIRAMLKKFIALSFFFMHTAFKIPQKEYRAQNNDELLHH